MKVLHVIPSIAPRYGGPSRAVIEMCRALRARDIETLIATTDADGTGRLPVELGQVGTYEGVPVICCARQWSEAYKYSRPLARWLAAHVREFDVVHIHAVFSHACLAAARACRKHGVPYIVRPLGTLDPWSLRQKQIRKKLFWYLGVNQMLKRAAAIHYTALPEQVLAEAALGLKRGVVVPLGVELATPPTRTEVGARGDLDSAHSQHPYILMLSRLHQKKGLELLLPAFLTVAKMSQFAKWKLVLAGEGDSNYVRSLHQLVERENGSERVIFTGWLKGTEKKAALSQASLLALTSYQENFGLCVIEALAYGVPVLISPHVNLAPQVEAAEAGWIVPMERSALERTLIETLQDAGERARRGAAGHELARSCFSWPSIAAQLATVYHAVV